MAPELDDIIRLRNLWFRLMYSLLSSVIDPVRRHKRAAVFVFLVVFGVFVVSAFRQGYEYVASASLLVSPPPYQSQVAGNEFIPPPLDVPSYAALLKDADILEKTRAEALKKHADLWKTSREKEALVPEVLANILGISTQVVIKTPQSVVYSRRLAVSARANSPERAKALLDAWVAAGIEAVRGFNLPGSDLTIEFVRGEYDKTNDELAAHEELLRAQQARWNIPLLMRTKSQKEAKLATLGTDLLVVEADAAQAQSELESLRTALQSEPEKKTLLRSPSNDAIAIIGAVGKSAAKAGPTFIDEIQNPVWVTLKQEESERQSKLAGLTARRDTLTTQIQTLETETAKLNEEVVAQQLKVEQLEREVNASKSYFDSLAAQREQVAALEANAALEGAGSIMLANAPVLPTQPINLFSRWGRVPLGALLGVAAAVAAANLVHEAKQARLAQVPVAENENADP